MIWRVYDADENMVAETNDLYAAEILAEAIGGHLCMNVAF